MSALSPIADTLEIAARYGQCFPIVHPPRARYFCPTSIGSSSSGVARVSFQRLRKPNSAITPTISTICSSVQCLRSATSISSVTALGHGGSRNSKIERRALGGAIERVCLVLPDRGEFLVFDTEVKRPSGSMGHAISAPYRAARDMRYDALEAAIDL